MNVQSLCWNDTSKKRQNHPLLPKSIRGLLIGKSGCGKTTLLMNLLMRPDWLDYNNLQVFGKSLFQPEYRVLKKALEMKLPKERLIKVFDYQDRLIKHNISPDVFIEELSKDIKDEDKPNFKVRFTSSASDVPDPSCMDPTDKNLMIFDDLQLEKQSKCEAYFVRGRHSNVDCFYLAQNYFNLPRQTIRENTNFMCIFKQDNKNINHLYNDHAAIDMPIEEFRRLCKHAWTEPHGFLVIDLSSGKDSGRYRSGFDEFYIPESN